MIALNLCQPHYQILLINYLKFIVKSVKDVMKEKKLNHYVILLGLKIINYKYKEYNKRFSKPINGLFKKFPDMYQFCNKLINFFCC